VGAILVDGATVYLGGSFISMGGQPRSRIAAVDASTALATSWNPNADLDVRAMVLSDTTLFVGGIFGNVGGQPRTRLAALSVMTGLARSWNANLGPNAVVTTVDALALSGSTLYVGGNFHQAGGQNREYIAAVDAGTALATAWNPTAGPNATLRTVDALTVTGSAVYAGGDFLTIGMTAREHLAAIDLATGRPTSWNPQPSNRVRCMVADGSTIYVGGDFLQVAFQPHAYVAAIDAVTGVPRAWNAAGDNLVTSIASDGTTIWAGGSFATLGGQPRNGLAALDAATGIATPWNPGVNAFVNALVPEGGTLYAGGEFTSIGGAPRNHLAALDAASGAVSSWDPNVTLSQGLAIVHALAVTPAAIVAGGLFDHVGSAPRNHIAAVDRTTAQATGWDPNADWVVLALQRNGSTIYAGGGFTHIGGQSRNRLAALDAATGLATPWNPDVEAGALCCDPDVATLAIGGPGVCVGGYLGQVLGTPTLHLSLLSDPFVVGVPLVTVGDHGLTLEPTAPHPVRDAARVRFVLPEAGRVSLDLLDAAGRVIRSVVRDRPFPAGRQETQLERGQLRPGLYFLRLRMGTATISRKVVLIP
jgi:hypothetical protein